MAVTNGRTVNYKGTRSLDILLFIVMASGWAFNYSFVKLALFYEPPLIVLLFRVMFGVIFSIPFSYSTLKLYRNSGLGKLFLMSLFNVSIFMSLWFIGERTEPPSISSILVYTYPIISVFLSWLLLQERMSIWKILGIMTGFAGVIVIFLDQISIGYSIGLLLLIGAAVSWAVGTIYYKKYLKHADMGMVNSFQFMFALPIVFVASLLYGGFRPITLNFILLTIYMGSIGSSVAYFIYWSLIRKYNVSHVSPYLFAVPAFSILFSSFLNNEALSVLNVSGFLLIAVGIFISTR